MSDKLIRAAFEIRLEAMAPAVATAHENEQYVPVTGTPYQRTSLMPATPENPTQDDFKRLIGFFQIMLQYPQGDGSGAAATRADAIRAWFPKRLTLSNGGISLIIDGTPSILPGFEDDDRWAVPVRVPYFANIS